jgi:hypothetical protein
MLKSPIWAMGDEEAKKIAEAFDGVAGEYSIKINPKYEAWINLAQVLGISYGARVMAYKAEKAFLKQQGNGATPVLR